MCDTAKRRADLTGELAKAAQAGGPDYEAIAALAARANLAYRYWETDCYPTGTASQSAGMSCDEAWNLTLHGTDDLEVLLARVALRQKAGS